MKEELKSFRVLTMFLSIVEDTQDLNPEVLHKERVSLIFPDSGEIYLGGNSFTKIFSYESIGYFMKLSALNILYPGWTLQDIDEGPEIKRLRQKLKEHKTPTLLKTRHSDTIVFFCEDRAKAHISKFNPVEKCPIFQGRFAG